MKFDPMQIFFYIIRVIPVIVVILLVAYIFFSFKVEVHTQEMDRLNIELAENILVSDMVVTKSVFNPKKLSEIVKNENLEKQKYDKYGLQPNPRICGYGYSISIAGQEEFYCDNGEDCVLLCMNMCGLSEADITASHYRCHRQGFRGIFGSKRCDCNCDPAHDKWDDKHVYQFGYESGFTELNTNQRDYPVAIYEDELHGFHGGSATPAIMTITLYDTWVTRISCMAERAYDLKEVQIMDIDKRDPLGVKKFDSYLCEYKIKNNNFEKIECMHSEIPVITFYGAFDLYRNKDIVLGAIPVKQDIPDINTPNYDALKRHTDQICENIDNYVVRSNEDVKAVVFCIKEKNTASGGGRSGGAGASGLW